MWKTDLIIRNITYLTPRIKRSPTKLSAVVPPPHGRTEAKVLGYPTTEMVLTEKKLPLPFAPSKEKKKEAARDTAGKSFQNLKNFSVSRSNAKFLF